MMRYALCFSGLAVLAGCAHWYEDDKVGKPAQVESRSVPGAVAAHRQTVERARPEPARRDAEPPAEGESKQVVELIAYSQRLSNMSAEEHKAELLSAAQEHSRQSALYNRVRLALVLAAPGGAASDDAKAASLLESVAAQPARTPLRQFAVLVHGLVQERVREQRRVTQLKEQIDGLRAIDRSLIEREQGRTR